jgi:predicted dehydrogenase
MFKWGIIGTGVVSNAFASGIKACNVQASVTSVYSRNKKSSHNFASSFNVKNIASNIEDLCNSGIDAVYIATPPKFHEKHAIECINLGIPVLIEKPFAYDSLAALRICDAAKEKNIFCMEGLWTRFLPLISELKNLINSGVLGELRFFKGDFMNANFPSKEVSQFDPKKGGGALMYRGVYALSLAQYFMGSFQKVSSIVNIGDTGVDDDCSINIQHVNGSISNIRASLRVNGENDLELHGTKGMIYVKGPIMRPQYANMKLYKPSNSNHPVKYGRLHFFKNTNFAQKLIQFKNHNKVFNVTQGGKKITKYYKGNGFSHEIEAFMQGVKDSSLESEIMPLSDTLEIMKTMDCLRNSWNTLEN